MSAAIDVNLFSRYFGDKVAKVRLVRDSALPPTFSRVRNGVSFSAFEQLTTRDIMDAIGRLPEKSSDANHHPETDYKPPGALFD